MSGWLGKTINAMGIEYRSLEIGQNKVQYRTKETSAPRVQNVGHMAGEVGRLNKSYMVLKTTRTLAVCPRSTGKPVKVFDQGSDKIRTTI